MATTEQLPTKVPTPQELDIDETVRKYLSQKGYKQTEQMFLHETRRSTNSDWFFPNTDSKPELYRSNYESFRNWVEDSLDAYKLELRSILLPLFVHVYLDLITKDRLDEAEKFMERYKDEFTESHSKIIQNLSVVKQPQHVKENEVAQNFRNDKYNLQLSTTVYGLFVNYLQDSKLVLLLQIVNQYLNIKVVNDQLLDTALPELNEANGITGYSVHDLDLLNQKKVYLGPRPTDLPYREEIQQTLNAGDFQPLTPQFEDHMQSPSLLEEFSQRIAREQSFESERGEPPLPPFKGIDVKNEITALEDTRHRVLLGPSANLPSICFYTFHNTYDSLNCMTISKDTSLIACGFSESYIKIWSLKGERLKAFKSSVKSDYVNGLADLDRLRERQGSECKRLTGHSGPVFGVSFSPDKRYLVSCSEDKTARLWSTDTYTNLVCYKGHNYPIWDIDFCPTGFYFATASYDRTARLWSCDHIFQLRIFSGHLSDVDSVKFHPNVRYVVTGSSDRTVRMWDIQTGTCMRVLSGHTGTVQCLAISEDGDLLASAGEDKTIRIWDLASGKCLKKLTGHTDRIYSLDFSKERSVLVSGSADSTVRVWDVNKWMSDEKKDDPMVVVAKTKEDGPFSLTGGKNKKETESNTSDDLLRTFPTKRTPVYRVQFTPRNLCLAAGAFNPIDSS